MIALVLLALIVPVLGLPPLVLQDSAHQTPFHDVKVPIQLGVMSRCPDALLCEAVFDQVLNKVRPKVDMSLVFIAKRNNSDPDWGVTCMHGPEECAGNVQELCAAKYAPIEQWWEFVQCQNFQGRDKIGLPDVALKCARSAGIDWEQSGVGKCAGMDGSGKGKEGVKLLRDSIKSAKELEITASCTVMISGEEVCIHDGVWRDCEGGHTVNDFVRQIDNEYDRLNST